MLHGLAAPAVAQPKPTAEGTPGRSMGWLKINTKGKILKAQQTRAVKGQRRHGEHHD